MTGNDFILGALQELNVYQQGAPLEADDGTLGLVWLNRLLDSWAAERLMMFTVLRTVKNLTSGTATYTIGATGSIAIQRPDYIQQAGRIQDTSATTVIEVPVSILDVNQWASVPQKTLAGPTTAIFYDRAYDASGLGTINCYPVQNTSTAQLVLYTPQWLAQFADLTTDYLFPPAYQSAIHYNLALALAGPFQAQPNPFTTGMATKSKALIKTPNLIVPEMGLDPALLGTGRFNIYSFQVGQ